jgi:hypothetical protein
VYVGQHLYDTAGDPANGGAVRVYDKSGGSWALVETIEGPASASANAYFGASIRVSGVYLVVGAYGWEDSVINGNQGAAFVYELVDGAHVLRQTIFPERRAGKSENGMYGHFNQGVAINSSGPTVVIGGRLAQPPTEPWPWGSDGPGVIRIYTPFIGPLELVALSLEYGVYPGIPPSGASRRI